MSSFTFELIAGGTGSFDVIFIHGLSGDPKGTWTSATATDPANAYWPLWVAQDVGMANVYALGYPAELFAKWIEESMSLYERAKAVLEYLAGQDFGLRPIAVIAHSLGGLLAKQIIRTGLESEDSDWQKIAKSIKFVAFLATPHSGSSLASVLGFVATKFISKHIETLKAGSTLLDELNQSYRILAGKQGIATTAYYETFKTKGGHVVTKESADPGVGGVNPIPIDADHATICKPVDRNAPIYRSVLRHLKKFADGCPQPAGSTAGKEPGAFFATEDYSTKSTDRRDLLEKLAAANREHEYRIANEAQNKFAQSYMKLGLHAAAREANDNLLSEVQQRFETHVYLAQICKGASDKAISNAIQMEVVDALVAKYGSSHKLHARTVIEAMYFLTEQCHLRWDPE
ncbi:ABC-three component system protein [Nitrospirillum sp. BR 11164]|uniref:ABC-three component system protein n=1 Tax=Nitrospirillum sp. BR 11164 TaxID=3104324 RepID=UPI002AFEEA79|nr:ABC-three component system protein [Nitrospirillum sp. BR 11164]MEA1647618.1 ABC-three component system protein [Nitrospirillum sp. BR 11164]